MCLPRCKPQSQEGLRIVPCAAGCPLGGEGQIGLYELKVMATPWDERPGGYRQLVTLPSSPGQASWGPAGLLFM